MKVLEIAEKWANQEEISREEVSFLLNNTNPVNHARLVHYAAEYGSIVEIRDVPGRESCFVFYKDGDPDFEQAAAEFDLKWSNRNGRHTWFRVDGPKEVIIEKVTDYKGDYPHTKYITNIDKQIELINERAYTALENKEEVNND